MDKITMNTVDYDKILNRFLRKRNVMDYLKPYKTILSPKYLILDNSGAEKLCCERFQCFPDTDMGETPIPSLSMIR